MNIKTLHSPGPITPSQWYFCFQNLMLTRYFRRQCHLPGRQFCQNTTRVAKALLQKNRLQCVST